MKEAFKANIYSLTEQKNLLQKLNGIMKKYYDSDFYKIMDKFEYVSMHFKMLYMQTYLEHSNEKCESPAELLLYDALIRNLRKTPAVQLEWKCSNNKVYRLDFAYFSKKAPIIFNLEVDGQIYHKCRIQKDKKRDAELARDNVIVLRITGKFIYKDPNLAALELINKMNAYHRTLKL